MVYSDRKRAAQLTIVAAMGL